MPELPEVETVARQLAPVLRGRVLRGVQLFDAKLAPLAVRPLIGGRVESVTRCGKEIAIALRGKKAAYLCVHLRMTGRLIWKRENAKGAASDASPDRHLRAVLRFDRGELCFYDPRRFGTLRCVTALEELNVRGREPLAPDFTAEELCELLAGSKQEIKTWLLRQDKLVGLGNIYASEILFRSRIHPQRPAGSLSAVEIRALHRTTRRVLEAAIRHAGTTFSDFRHTTGSSGGFQRFLKVYDREGKPCTACAQPIARIVGQGRSTYYCSSCQPRRIKRAPSPRSKTRYAAFRSGEM